MKRLSIDLQLMYRLINGLEAPFSNLMNGSIDADNLDNVPHYLVSSGISRQSHLFEDIASSFSREGGTFALRQQQDAPWTRVTAWLFGRREPYHFIHSEKTLRQAQYSTRQWNLPTGTTSLSQASSTFPMSRPLPTRQKTPT